MNDTIEKMLSLSTIDDPVETRQLLLEIEANLPIPVRFSERGLHSLKAEGTYLADEQGIYQVEYVTYAGDMGGILCSMMVEEENQEGDDNEIGGVTTSITHLKIDPIHPLAEKIKNYQKKRALALAIANSGRSHKPAKPKKKKKGFGS
jgi:hypothetical protein